MLAPFRFQLTTNKDCGMARKVGKGVFTKRETGFLPKQCSGQISPNVPDKESTPLSLQLPYNGATIRVIYSEISTKKELELI